jgi:hypothetical protein
MLTQERLKELLSYDPGTGLFVWINNRSNVVKAGHAGSLDGDKYRRIMIDNTSYKAHRLAWLYMTGLWPKDQIDHTDHDRSNNKWPNLREVSNTENSKNKKLYKSNKSGHVGVLWHRKDKRWQASIRVDGKLKHLGNFKEKLDAIIVRKIAEKECDFHKNHGAVA